MKLLRGFDLFLIAVLGKPPGKLSCPRCAAVI